VPKGPCAPLPRDLGGIGQSQKADPHDSSDGPG